MIEVDEDQVLADLRTLAGFGKLGTGVNRLFLTEQDMAARAWLVSRMAEAGLDATIDGVGNVYGRSREARRTVVIGSHTDTVPEGGWLDGAMGVIFGLGVARAWQKQNPGSDRGIDVLSFADEEGTFLACLGSRSFCGLVTDTEIEPARNSSGTRLVDRLIEVGLAGKPRAVYDPARHRAYLEAHIEQGPRLAADGLQIGAVTGIVGVRRYRITFVGQADHAGTTPMAMRKDASSALFKFAIGVEELFKRVGSAQSVWNFGIVTVRPGGANVVPAEAELVAEFRDLSPEILGRMEAEFQAAVAAANGRFNVGVSAKLIGTIDPAAMDERLVDIVEKAAAGAGASRMRMPSGAGHDAMILARRMPAGMLFVPSIGGRSHDIAEDTSEADIRRGLRVFAAATEKAIDAIVR